MKSTALIILAAGASSRMGEPKQLLPIGAETLLSLTIKTALAISTEVIVVLGANLEQHRERIAPLPVRIVINQDWENGMGSSLKMGLAPLLDTKVKRAIVLVCDQPHLTAFHLQELVNKHNITKKSIIASGYGGTIGVPVLFHRSYFGTLMKMEDKSGAKQIISAHPDDVAIVDFPGGAVDLDTKADYLNFMATNRCD